MFTAEVKVNQLLLSQELVTEVKQALARAGQSELCARIEAEGEPAPEMLTTKQAAVLLELKSTNTVKNWLEGGQFPGAFQTEGGHWRIPRSEVEKTRLRRRELADKNRRRDFTAPDEDAREPPLL